MGAVYPAGLVNVFGETLSLSTTLASLGLPGNETKQAIIYNPSSDFRLHINPAIRRVSFYDASAAAGARYKELTRAVTDRQTTGSGTTLDSRQSGDRLYICCADVVSGIRVDIVDASPNGTACVLTANYWNGSAWTDLSASDGTVSSGKSFAADGSITWTVPTDWLAAYLDGPNASAINTVLGTAEADGPGDYGFWIQFAWTQTFDSDTELQDIWTLNKNTNRGYFRAGQEYHLSFDRRNVGAIEAVLASGTDTLELTWIRTII